MIAVTRPTLLVDEKKCRENIKSMADKARRNKVLLRPHFKTHQSHEVGRWFRDEGVTACTVSSVRMATYFVEDGWNDITVAFPLNHHEKGEINKLAAKIQLNLLVVNAEAIVSLKKELRHPVGVFIEIDPGYHRTGVAPDDSKAIDEILAALDSRLFSFKGFLAHAGHSYACRSKAEIQNVHEQSMKVFRELGDRYRKRYPEVQLAPGDTPTCAVAEDFSGMTEIRPGNLVFYDFMQTEIGSCSPGEVAIAMACPVVAIYPEREEVAVHGGSVHFSKDSFVRKDGKTVFGEVVRFTSGGWGLPVQGQYVKSLSQEHGIIHVPKKDIESFKVGDIVGVLPVHSCLTADAMGEYYTLDGKRIVMMPKL